MVQLSHPYVTTGKTIALTIRTSVDKVTSLLFNTLSRFVIAFLPRSNRLLMSWLQSPSSVILEPKKRKSVTASTFSLSTCQEVMGPDVMILGFFSFFLSFFFNIEAFQRVRQTVFLKNMVFIKKASISREVWFSSEARRGRLPPAFSNNAVIDAAFEMYIVF